MSAVYQAMEIDKKTNNFFYNEYLKSCYISPSILSGILCIISARQIRASIHRYFVRYIRPSTAVRERRRCWAAYILRRYFTVQFHGVVNARRPRRRHIVCAGRCIYNVV